MEGMNLFSLLNNTQNNPERRSVDLFRTQGGNKGQMVRNNTNEEARELSFREVLQNISDKTKDNKKEKPVDLKEVRNKLDDIEKKLDKLSAQEGGNKDTIEKIKAVVKEIKKILAGASANPSGWDVQIGNSSVDILAYMAQVLEQIGLMLDKQNFADSANALGLIKNQLQDISGKMGLDKTAPVKAENTALNAGTLKNTESENKPDEKVVIIDKRTKPEEAGPAKPGINKETKTSTGDAAFNLFKTENKENKSGIAQLIKTAEKDISDRAATRETTVQNFMKTEAQAVSARPAVTYTSPVSRAALESLMQNITGRALVTLKDGKSELRMSLMPPELGKMSMKLSLEDGQLLGKIVVSTQEAKMLFDQNMGDLQRALQQAGINIGGLDVSLSQDDQNSTGQAAENVQAYPEMTAEEKLEELKYSPHSLFESSINFLA